MPQTSQTSLSDNSFQEEIDTLYPYHPQKFGNYGDLQVIANYLGFKEPPCGLNGEWQHGHIEPERNVDPDFVIGSDGMSRLKMNSRYFVAREDQREYLHSSGYNDVHCIGLPFTYAKPLAVNRIENSLLVMPFHTISGMDVNRRKHEEQYMEYIDSISGRFSKIVCCLHRNDYDNGDWKRHFNDRGMETIVGGDPNDSNSILRMAYLFSKFDFITGNSWGSHLAYGAYFGAKVSIAGPETEIQRETFERLTYYKNKPRLLQLITSGLPQEIRKAKYPFLWCDPWDAREQTEWANFQLGKSFRRSPKEIMRLFQWPNQIQQVKRKYILRLKSVARPYVSIIRGILPHRGTNHDPFNPEAHVILGKVGASYTEDSTHINVFGCAWANFAIGLQLRKNTSDAQVFEQVIGKQEYHPALSLLIKNGREPHWILDCGANIGITSLYFRNCFPRCSLICVEADKENFQQLQSNFQEQDNVYCHHRAIWHNRDQLLSIGTNFRDGKAWSKSVDSNREEDGTNWVKSITINDLIDTHQIDVVDLLKIDIEGAEHEIFEKGNPIDFLSKVRFLAVEIHDEVANRNNIHRILKEASFTIFESGELTIGINRRLAD